MALLPAKKLNEIRPAVMYGVWLSREDCEKVNESPLIDPDGMPVLADDNGQFLMHTLLVKHYEIGPTLPGKGHWGMVSGVPYRSLTKRDESFAAIEQDAAFLGYRIDMTTTLRPNEPIVPTGRVQGQINWMAITLNANMVAERMLRHNVYLPNGPTDLEAALFMLPTDARRLASYISPQKRDISPRMQAYNLPAPTLIPEIPAQPRDRQFYKPTPA